MLLKALELHGFKTFPDKTVLSFGSGITAVVGPNGSGKSNISDAIRWVLGEQSIKTLRCSKMEDVVFGGTPTRKAQGFAEVTLTIENKDRRLPFDRDEVSITRRYYRSGESEYLMNKASVRLRDIHELFMDTGLGRDGYSMISQGKIDSIVASKSEDRREIFEEAAGISRYRYRKLEAKRKLKQAEENLLRLRDILVELEDRVGPLEEQAKKAKDYLSFIEEKRTLEIGLWLNTLDQSSQILREQDHKISISRNQHLETEKALDAMKREIEDVFRESNSYTASIDEVRRKISAFEETATQKLGQASVLENDMLHNNENIARIRNEIEESDASFSNIDNQIQNKKEEIEKILSELTKKQTEANRSAEKLTHLREHLDQFSGQIHTLSQELSSLSIKASDVKLNVLTAESSLKEIETRTSAVADDISSYSKQIQDLEQTLSDYLEMNQDAECRVYDLSNTVKGYELKLQTKKQKSDQLKRQADQLSLDAEGKIRRIRLLEELERNLEGFAQSVKVVMKEAKRGVLSGIHGPVSRLIKVPSEYATAIETALGSSMQHIVVDADYDAKRAIALLKQRDSGRATFLPLSTIRGKEVIDEALYSCPGFIGLASRLCNTQLQYEGILHSLLGKIIIVDHLDNAVTIGKRFHYRFRIVTLDGQVVNSGGSLTGGSLSRSAGLLRRTTEIEKLKKQADTLKREAHQARTAYHESEQEVARAESSLLGCRGDLANAQEERILIDAQCKTSRAELSNMKRLLEQFTIEKNTLKEKTKSLSDTRMQSETQHKQITKEFLKIEDQIAAITGNREDLSKKREELTGTLQEIRLAIVSHQKDIELIRSEIKSMENRKLDQAGKIKEFQLQIEEITKKNSHLTKEIESIKTESQQLREKAKKAEKQIEEYGQKRLELEKRSVKLRQFERDKSLEKEKIGLELARLEEQKSGLQKEYDGIISKLWEEYELTRREAEETAEKIEDSKKAQKRLYELKLKIKNLGSINVGAIEEYKEVSERYQFMKHQTGDIEKSKDELIKLIHDLTHQMKELFLTRFQQINDNFTLTFRELFGGGKADLTMTNPDDILNSGIEIAVEPPGKIVTHLESLSGGEKALVAIALYFAIMKVSPAPFCVLDEIEAALDDVNVDRYAAYLRKMNNNTQFIVITHRRGTMEEADVLYGVTMQDEGVSKLLELRASEIEQKLGIKQ